MTMNIIKVKNSIYLIGEDGYGINLDNGFYSKIHLLDIDSNYKTKIKNIKVKSSNCLRELKGFYEIYTIKESKKSFFVYTRNGHRLITTNYIYPLVFIIKNKIGEKITKSNFITGKYEKFQKYDDDFLPNLIISKQAKSITIMN